jgi:hypothetical protein
MGIFDKAACCDFAQSTDTLLIGLGHALHTGGQNNIAAVYSEFPA